MSTPTPDPITTPAPFTPGINTSEFYVTVISTLIAWGTALGFPIHVSSTTVQAIAAVAAVVIPIVYTSWRGMIKVRHPLPTTAPPVAGT